MNVGITLKQAEKYFGPSVIGKDRPDNTISVIANPIGRGETYVGLPGIRDDAQFYIHFPQSIDLTTIIETDHRNYRRQPADHFVGLRKDGPLREDRIAKLKSAIGSAKQTNPKALLSKQMISASSFYSFAISSGPVSTNSL